MFGIGIFGRWLSREDGALINGIGAFIKETPESSFLFLPPWADTVRRLLSVNQEDQQLVPWSWISRLQNCKKAVSAVHGILSQPERSRTASQWNLEACKFNLFFWKDPSIHLGSSGFSVSTTRKLVVKNTPASSGDIRDLGLIPGLGRSPGGGHGNPLQYSCLENPMGEELGGLWSVGSQRVWDDWSYLARTQCTSVQ